MDCHTTLVEMGEEERVRWQMVRSLMVWSRIVVMEQSQIVVADQYSVTV